MSGHTKFSDLRHKGAGDAASAARMSEYERAIDAALALADVRKGRELTQTDVAKVLGVTQVNISRIEHADDLFVSTLRGYVEAMGGQLELRAVFPEEEAPVELELAGA